MSLLIITALKTLFVANVQGPCGFSCAIKYSNIQAEITFTDWNINKSNKLQWGKYFNHFSCWFNRTMEWTNA